MVLHITPEILRASYELLRTTPPFKRWKLPHGDLVEFHVMKTRGLAGQYVYGVCRGKPWHRIRICVTHRTLARLTETMAHEMVHMRQRQFSHRWTSHGVHFKQLARLACRYHGYDIETF